jgi:hypothetical protein
MAMILGVAALLLPNPMGVIESDQPFSVSSMERQRLVQAVRLLRSDGDASHHKANLTTALRVNNQR